eukprot:scaffold5611_cov132-Isochrysis_galbana.AAC.1
MWAQLDDVKDVVQAYATNNIDGQIMPMPDISPYTRTTTSLTSRTQRRASGGTRPTTRSFSDSLPARWVCVSLKRFAQVLGRVAYGARWAAGVGRT